jgi:hypothetical protein
MMFWKKPTTKHPKFGVLVYSHDRWLSEVIQTESGNALVSIEGDRISPNETAIAFAEKLLEQTSLVVLRAISFVQADSEALEFIAGQGDLILDGFFFGSNKDSFEVELALSDWPDAMISVVFKDGLPCEVLLAD